MNKGDPAKQPPECKSVFKPFTDEFPFDPLRDPPNAKGYWTQCPNLKMRDDFIMDSETYECEVCGRHEKLYYEDMA